MELETYVSLVEDRVDELRGTVASLRDDLTAVVENRIIPMEMEYDRLEKRVSELEGKA